MAHMFLIDYIANHVNGMVESGKALVVADSHDQAHDLLCLQMQLPPTRTRSESMKIKPPCYSLQSRESHPDKTPASDRTRAPQRERDPRMRFHVNVTTTNVVGHNERQVLRKIGEELIARGMQASARHHLQMTVDCWLAAESATSARSMTPMEKIETYGARSGRVQGGQVRGR